MGQTTPINAIPVTKLKNGIYRKRALNGRIMVAGEPYVVPAGERLYDGYVYVLVCVPTVFMIDERGNRLFAFEKDVSTGTARVTT